MEELRVVVVEDEYYVRKGIIQSFDWEKLGCVIVGEAANGKAGIEVVEQCDPDLVIVDIEMPVMDGIEMVKRLKSKRRLDVIFLTAHQKFTYVHSALKLEAVDYLLKPFRYEELEECIRRVRTKEHKLDAEEEKDLLLTQKELQIKNGYIKDAVAYVRKHYAEEISNVTAAEKLDINSAYFCRLFKKETGYTFGQYLTNYRIHVAAGLLTNFDMRINEVAMQVGIPDSNYFSQVFKKIMGMTPKEYQDAKKVF